MDSADAQTHGAIMRPDQGRVGHAGQLNKRSCCVVHMSGRRRPVRGGHTYVVERSHEAGVGECNRVCRTPHETWAYIRKTTRVYARVYSVIFSCFFVCLVCSLSYGLLHTWEGNRHCEIVHLRRAHCAQTCVYLIGTGLELERSEHILALLVGIPSVSAKINSDPSELQPSPEKRYAQVCAQCARRE